MFTGDEGGADYHLGIDADGASYWRHQAERHRQHRRSVVSLIVAMAILIVFAFAWFPPFAWCAVALIPFLALESWQARRTRPTTKIPDYRPLPTVEVPLDTE